MMIPPSSMEVAIIIGAVRLLLTNKDLWKARRTARPGISVNMIVGRRENWVSSKESPEIVWNQWKDKGVNVMNENAQITQNPIKVAKFRSGL